MSADITPTTTEAKDLADDCIAALEGMFSDPPRQTLAMNPITQQVLAEMQKAVGSDWSRVLPRGAIRTYLGINSINWCARFLRWNGHSMRQAGGDFFGSPHDAHRVG